MSASPAEGDWEGRPAVRLEWVCVCSCVCVTGRTHELFVNTVTAVTKNAEAPAGRTPFNFYPLPNRFSIQCVRK